MKRRKLWLLALCLAALPLRAARAEIYQIDPAKSGFLVNTGVAGLFKKFGRPLTMEVRNYSGTIHFDPQNSGASSLKLKSQANSVALKTQMIEVDRMNIEMRMHEKVLESEKFPEIEYVSDKVKLWKTGANRYDADIEGSLTLHGTTRHLPLRATITVHGNRLEASGEVAVSQKEFGVKTYGYEGGALRVADEVKISFDLVATR